jgi:hypothetical protein
LDFLKFFEISWKKPLESDRLQLFLSYSGFYWDFLLLYLHLPGMRQKIRGYQTEIRVKLRDTWQDLIQPFPWIDIGGLAAI